MLKPVLALSVSAELKLGCTGLNIGLGLEITVLEIGFPAVPMRHVALRHKLRTGANAA